MQRDEAVAPARKELIGERRAERARFADIGDGALHFVADDFAAVARREQPAQPQAVFLPLGVRRERCLATAAERTRERALRGRREHGAAIGERSRDPLSMYMADICTLPASLAGIPALSLPCGVARPAAGGPELPVGLQIMAPAFEEARLLRVAHALEGRLSDRA